MSNNLSRQLVLIKQAVTSRGGAVAAQNQKAADVGAGVLAAGGNAVDAAIATAFALAALEPWMSGLGGIGHMLVYDARQRRAHAIDFGAISARGLDPADYPLTGRTDRDLFGWPEVADDRNVLGYGSIAVPGQPEGMRAAHERFATRRWPELLEPAIALAEEGIAADWFATLIIASGAAAIGRFPASAAWFLRGGLPPVIGWDGALPRLKNAALARTLRTLSARGARDLYEGGLGAALVADLAAGGSAIDKTDLANFHARFTEPLDVAHGEKRLRMPAGLTAGPTLADALSRVRGQLGEKLDADAVVAHALALSRASAVRLETLGEAKTAAECTTHLSVIDRDGNMVALTQTLLSLFGSKVVLPETGILMNNGINWFDPRPGRPNSLGAGKRPLSNMLPVLGFAGDKPWLAIGASGGRRIMPAIFQLISFQADFGLGLEAAFHHPRIDTSVAGEVAVDPRIAPETRAALARHFSVTERARVPYPLPYACPIAVAVEGSGERVALTELSQPWAGAAAG
jgi:gamma-glutamyltranspeptidase / glutathione hydrolase